MSKAQLKKQFIETFAFLLSQEIAIASPKDTGRLSKSFPATVEIDGNIIKWTLPFYWKFVEFGTIRQTSNPFIRTTLHQKGPELFEKTLKIISSKS